MILDRENFALDRRAQIVEIRIRASHLRGDLSSLCERHGLHSLPNDASDVPSTLYRFLNSPARNIL